MKNTLIILVTLFLLSACGRGQPKTLLGKDYRIFEHTTMWDLAQVVRDNDTTAVERIVKTRKTDLDFQEPKFGETLLMCAILNRQYAMSKKLLELGANPNIHDRYNGNSAIFKAVNNGRKKDTTFMKLLLAHGANPNDRETEGTMQTAPIAVLTRAAEESLEKVRVLVNAGANVNEPDSSLVSPLGMALTLSHYDIVLYLMSKGSEYRGIVDDRSHFGRGKLHISDMLREDAFFLDSEEYRQKMEVVKFLLAHGIDYRKSPIPPIAIEHAKKMYPNSWQEYLEKY